MAAASEHEIVLPRCGGRVGHPIAFGRKYWPALCAVAGNQGAKSVVRGADSQRRYCEVDDPGIYSDVDTPEQLRALTPQFSPP